MRQRYIVWNFLVKIHYIKLIAFILSLELELDMKWVVSFYTKEIDGKNYIILKVMPWNRKWLRQKVRRYNQRKCYDTWKTWLLLGYVHWTSAYEILHSWQNLKYKNGRIHFNILWTQWMNTSAQNQNKGHNIFGYILCFIEKLFWSVHRIRGYLQL